MKWYGAQTKEEALRLARDVFPAKGSERRYPSKEAVREEQSYLARLGARTGDPYRQFSLDVSYLRGARGTAVELDEARENIRKARKRRMIERIERKRGRPADGHKDKTKPVERTVAKPVFSVAAPTLSDGGRRDLIPPSAEKMPEQLVLDLLRKRTITLTSAEEMLGRKITVV